MTGATASRFAAVSLLTAAVAIVVSVQDMYRKRAEGDWLGEVILLGSRLAVDGRGRPGGERCVAASADDNDRIAPNPNEAALGFVKRAHANLARLVETSATKESLAGTLDGLGRYDGFARRALGDPCSPSQPTCTNHWSRLSTGEQAEVTDLLRQVVQGHAWKHRDRLRSHDVNVSYGNGNGIEGEGARAAVRARYTRKASGNSAVRVDYLVDGAAHDLRLLDVMVEGSMISKNYYVQFDRMLTTSGQGYAYMVAKLRTKIGKP